MGKEKRLFLLAVMTVMMSTVGYGGIHKEFKQDKTNPDKVQEIQEPDFSVIGSNTGYKLMTGKSDKDKTTVVSSTNINVDSDNAKGIHLFLGEETKGKNKFINKGIITVSKGTGFYLETNEKNSNKGATNTFINDGTIKVAGGKGIQLDNEKDVVTNNNEIIVDKDTNGVGVSMSAGNFTNSETGTITVSGGKGIEQTGGTSTNNGKIDVSNSGSIGINQSNGTVNNSGSIKSEAGATGIKITNGTFNNVSKDEKGNILKVGKIEATGQYRENENSKTATPSIGMEINGAGVNVVNEGLVSTETGGIGVKVSKGTFNNKILKDKNGEIIGGKITSSGVNAFIYSENKKIKATINSSVGVSVNGGTFYNEGLVSAETGGIGVRVSSGTFNNKIIKDKD